MIAVIGGSGFYDYLENVDEQVIDTPFGEVSYDFGQIHGKNVVFIPRHGKGHSLIPNNINYRANIFAAHLLDVEFILVTNAVGSINDDIKPGTIAVPNQIIDFTSSRAATFFDGSNLEVTTRSGKTLAGVVHTDVTHPYDPEVRRLLLDAGKHLQIPVHDGGVMVVLNGPRYETPAEIDAYRILGADFAGMTSAPEVFLAKELEIPYATMAVVTNYAAGMQEKISHEEVDQMFKKQIDVIKSIFSHIISSAN